MWSVQFDDTWYKYFAGFYYGIWKRVAKQKVKLLPEYTELMNSCCSFSFHCFMCLMAKTFIYFIA